MSKTQDSVEYQIPVERIIGHLKGKSSGPTLVFFAGIHGNEHAGVLALQHVFQELNKHNISVKGEVYAIAGNLNALSEKVRFHIEDLNRIWIPDRIKTIQSKNGECNAEEIELLQLYNLLGSILKTGKPPFYFIDLHTTSSHTTPFVVLNDSLLNRKFASNYSLPIILGIEEYLEGALLSYINDMGYVSLGYESGQHDDPQAIGNCIDFICHTLLLAESVNVRDYEKIFLGFELKNPYKPSPIFYEIYYQYKISHKGNFKMLPGFENFQHIPKGIKIANANGTNLYTKRKRQIFMPLYQNQGSEGFYFIKPIPKVLLWISKGLRRFKVDYLLIHLPGIAWKSKKKDVLLVNQKVARFMIKSFFHLMGYRARQYNNTHLVVKNREAASKTKDYTNTSWFKNKKRGPY